MEIPQDGSKKLGYISEAMSQISQSMYRISDRFAEIAERQQRNKQALEMAQYKSDLNHGRSLMKTINNRWQLQNEGNMNYQELPDNYTTFMRNKWDNVLNNHIQSDRAKQDLQYEFEEYLSKQTLEVQSTAQARQGELLLAQYEDDYDTTINDTDNEEVLQDLRTLVNDHVEAGIIDGEKAAEDWTEGVKTVLENRIVEHARENGYDDTIMQLTEQGSPEIEIGEETYTLENERVQDLVDFLADEKKERQDIIAAEENRIDEQLYSRGLDDLRNGNLTYTGIEMLRQKGLSAANATKLYDRLQAQYDRQRRIREDREKERDEVKSDEMKVKAEQMYKDITLRVGHAPPEALEKEFNELVRGPYGKYLTDSDIRTTRNYIDKARETVIPKTYMDAIDDLERNGVIGPSIVREIESNIYDTIIERKFPEEGVEKVLTNEEYESIFNSYIQPYMEDRLKEISGKALDIWHPEYENVYGRAPAAQYKEDEAKLDRVEREYKYIIERLKRGEEYEGEEIEKLKDPIEEYSWGFKWHFKRFPPEGADIPNRWYDPPVRYAHGVIPVFEDASGNEWAVDIVGKNERWKRWNSEKEMFSEYDVTATEDAFAARVNTAIQKYAGQYDSVIPAERSGEMWILGANAGDTEYTPLEKVE
jgi:hypothetical protein